MSIEFNRETHENKNRKDIIGIHDNEIANRNLDIDACLRLGDALHKQERYEEAVAVYDRALAAHTDCGALYYNKGNALLELQRWEEAVRVYFRAVSLIPAFAEGYVTIATALQALRRPYEAMASCYRALAIDPCCAEAHWNLALALLQVGEYAKGWEEFEWRWKKRGYTSKQRQFPQPAWAGEPLSGRTILIHAEQALGDTVQFARFLPLVAECGGRVILECPAPLKGLMAGMDGVQQAYATGEKLPHFDLHLPLMSLPKILRTTIEALPVDVPYLAPGLEHVAEWAGKFNTHDELRAGIVWAGRKKPDPNRTCPLEQFIPLAQVPGVKFYSLQIGEKGEGDDAVAERLGLADLTSAINDFRDTAAFIAQLDLVISIDTSVAHLAGAMGRETWTLLPHAADWRWMLDRDDSPWYPNMRLFRQERPGDWQGVMVRIGTALMEKSRDTAATLTLPSPELEAHYVDATDSLRRDDLKEAEKSLQKALLLNCRIPEIYNGLGILAESTRKRKTALAFLHKAISSDHDYPDAHINLGNILFKENRIDEAVAEYLRAIEISPGNVMALQNLGVAFQSQGRLREAAECFR
ncbi:MAG TPA: tetratricopeptide repeat protein, partial [Geobacteraceae bacterium]|nr:tetratricopeptide repeat protein [Geobacteraceae bacterium]